MTKDRVEVENEKDARRALLSFRTRLIWTLSAGTAWFLILILLVQAYQALLIIFMGVLGAIFFRGLGDWLAQHTKLSQKVAVLLVWFSFLVCLILGAWAVLPKIFTQTNALILQLPNIIRALQEKLARYEFANSLLEMTPPLESRVVALILDKAPSLTILLLSGLATMLIALFAALYGSVEPALYTRGFIRLVPVSKRGRAAQILESLLHTLRWWLIGRMSSSFVVGVLISSSLWFIGMPYYLSLGLLAALLDFIPNLGPVISAIPAVILGFAISTRLGILCVLLYLCVQLLEAYVIYPLILRKTVQLPPIFTLGAQLLFAVLAGPLGFLLADPLALILRHLIISVYIEGILEDRGHESVKRGV